MSSPSKTPRPADDLLTADAAPDPPPGLSHLVLTAGLPFGLVVGAVIGWMRGPLVGLALGALGGLAFALAFQRLMSTAARRRLGPPAHDGPIRRTGRANHFVGWESVGGTLHLTGDSLFFESHGMNVRDHELRIALGDITAVSPARTLGLIPNGVIVEHGDTRERFVVSGRRAWVEAIEAARRA